MTRWLIFLTAMAACSERIYADGATTVDLTKDDVVALYDVPVATRPAYKLEWKSATPTTYHMTIESRAVGGDWKASYSADQTPAKYAWLTILLDDRPLGDGRLPVMMRWGFANGDVSGWSSHDFSIDSEPAERAVNSPGAPGEVLRLSTETYRYRVRVEKVAATPAAPPAASK